MKSVFAPSNDLIEKIKKTYDTNGPLTDGQKEIYLKYVLDAVCLEVSQFYEKPTLEQEKPTLEQEKTTLVQEKTTLVQEKIIMDEEPENLIEDKDIQKIPVVIVNNSNQELRRKGIEEIQKIQKIPINRINFGFQKTKFKRNRSKILPEQNILKPIAIRLNCLNKQTYKIKIKKIWSFADETKLLDFVANQNLSPNQRVKWAGVQKFVGHSNNACQKHFKVIKDRSKKLLDKN